jgi:HAD superfamily hydrolase (TIGR01549 family)
MVGFRLSQILSLPTMRSSINRLRMDAKYRLGVVSNFSVANLPAQYLESFGLRNHFDFVLDSAAFGYKKPDPRIFYQALALAGLSSDEAGRVLFIGDHPDRDIYPARGLGMQTMHFNRGRTRPSVPPSPAG